MNDIKIFSKPEFGKVGVLTAQDGTPWFNAVDVCKVLGYKRPNDAVAAHVDEPDTAKQRIRSGGQMREVNFVVPEDLIINETLTSGGKQKVNFVDEADVRKTDTRSGGQVRILAYKMREN